MIDLEKLWIQYDRIIKENGAIILTAQTPFDKVLGASNIDNLRYEWIWEKTAATGHLNAKKMPLKAHENILVFYKKLPIYNPQKTVGHTAVHSYTKKQTDGSNYGRTKAGITGGGSTERYPRSVLTFKSDKQKSSLHPTQKPVALFEYLIKTYTNEGGLVLYNCMGSGTTAIACLNT
ncbi:site-specific DNA-methyltransferase, partial [Listeria monocytogenes]|nr:site-specific DNA-methyltransferase [Listeria monocytogenes]